MVVILRHQVVSLLFLINCFMFFFNITFVKMRIFSSNVYYYLCRSYSRFIFIFYYDVRNKTKLFKTRNTGKHLYFGVIFIVILFLPVINNSILTEFSDLNSSFLFYLNNFRNWYDFINLTANIETYGQVLYFYYVLQLLISGLILLVALVGVVYLTNNFSKRYSRYQSIFKQLSRNSKSFF